MVLRPNHWKGGDLGKMNEITEEGRLTVIHLLEYYTDRDVGIKPESLIPVEQLLEALGAEGYEFT